MLQIKTCECWRKPYPKCHKTDNGKGCRWYSASKLCEVDLTKCKKACFPDFTSCCDCGEKNCFPSTSKIKLANGKSVMMSELQLGDQVQTGNTFFSHLNVAKGLKQ